MSEEKNITGFNYGYELAKLNPALAKSIVGSIQADSPESMSYFSEGVKQFQKERLIERVKDQDEHQQSRDRGKGFDRR